MGGWGGVGGGGGAGVRGEGEEVNGKARGRRVRGGIEYEGT